MSYDDDDPTVLGSLLKGFRSESQSAKVDRRTSLYVPPTFSLRTPTLVEKRSYSDVFMHDSATSSKKPKDEDDSTAIEPTTPTNNSKYDSSVVVPGSPWEVRRLHCDLVVARAEVAALERQLEKLHSLREAAEITFKKEKNIVADQLEHVREKARSLEHHNHELRQREKDCRSELEETRQELLAVKSKLERQVLEYRKESTALKDRMMEVERICEQKVKEANSQLAEAKMQLEFSQRKIEMQSNSLKDKDMQMKKLIEESRLMEQNYRALQGTDIRAQQLERELLQIKSAEQEVLSKQEKLRNYLTMEEDNRLLRAKNKELHDLIYGKLLLEEQVNNLKDQLQGVDDIECNAARHAQENTQLRSLLDSCRELLQEAGQAQETDADNYDNIPSLLKCRLESLWGKHKAAVDEKLETINNWRESERKLDRQTAELDKATKQVEKLQTAHDQQTNLIRRLQKKLLLISRERDSYRDQLDAFERDLTITPRTAEQEETASRIQSQERVITMYRDMLEKLEEELNNLQSSADAGKWEERLRKAEAERDAMAVERDKQVKRCKEVESQLDKWVEQAFREDKRPRLLTIGLKDNPVQWAVSRRTRELNELKSECKKLRARVHLLMLGDQEVTQNLEGQQKVEKELEELRNEVKSKETKMLRLKEAFRNTSQNYRETIFMLMGYTVDRVTDEQYKLISAYAESPSDFLMFKLNTKGSLDLLETTYSKTLKDMIDFHLKEQESIPMFLSSLTASLFHKQSVNSTVDKDTMSLCSSITD